jgi:molybdopterin-synthase adenylyltransferase
VRAPVNAVSAAMSATLMLYAAMAVLTGVPRIDAGSTLGVNLMVPGEMPAQTYPPSPDCPLCSTAAGGQSFG